MARSGAAQRSGVGARAALALGLALAALLAGASGRADPLTLLAQERGVFARSQASASGEFGQEIEPAEAADFAFFEAAAAVQSASGASSADAAASLLANLDAEGLGAAAAASSAAAAASADGWASAPADAFFEVLFRSDAAQSFRLLGELAAGASPSGADGYARVDLVEDASGASLFSRKAAPGEGESFDETALLAAGVSYRLTAYALSRADLGGAPPDGAAQASFEVVLGVPEPARELLLAAGAALLLGLGRRRGTPR
jgi:hypothetical protein